ncbi:hypothetical protein ACFQ71_02950 [Streptomyces sp. NPDC056534]|uniref:hypothetical protein n=1 Tax=Streptomyces sp. NPDC056534 TaxID=3345857 RepID=UPI0036D0532B
MSMTIRVPSQIRRHVLKKGRQAAKTPGEVHLYAACQEGAATLESRGMNSLNTIELHLTNAALGAALDIARGWLDSDNGNNVMAAKSLLKFELEYEPSDPREIRHEIKMPKSLTGYFAPRYGYPSPYEKDSEVVKADMGRMGWATAGASGRVRTETLGLILRMMDRLTDHDHSAVKRAASKFVSTYTAPYEKTQKLITAHLAKGEPALDFTEAVHGRDEAEAAGPTEWKSGELRHVMNLTDRGASPVIWFGGKAGRKTPDPGEWRVVVVNSLGSGKYQLTDMGTQEDVLTAALTSQIHWATVEQTTPTPVEVEDQEHDEPEAKPAAKPQLYEVPENWLELAEEGNTPQARAYWTRRCEEYRRTGK